jgi:hypothetical protein
MTKAEQRERRERMRVMWESGERRIDIARAFGVTGASVKLSAKYWGWSRPEPPPKPDLWRERWVQMLPAMKAAVRAAAGGA